MSAEKEPSTDKQLIQLLAAIGTVAVRWAQLEHEINTAIWSLANTSDREGACLTAQIPAMMSRMRALIALLRESGISEKLIGEMNSFTKEADEVARKRNRIVHDPWYFKKEGGGSARLEITADRKVVYELKPHELEKVLKTSDEIHGLSKAFYVLMDRVNGELRDSLKEQIEEAHGKGTAAFLDPENRGSAE